MHENSKLYELMILVPGNLSADEAEKTLAEVKGEITSIEGEITGTENWGRRELAYAVAQSDYGYYFVIYANIPANKVSELNNFCRINRNVSRHLLLARPEGITPVDYSTVKTGFGGRIKDETTIEAEKTVTKVEKKPAKKIEKPVVIETVEKKVEKKPVAKAKKAEKGLDDILSELDKNLEL